MTQLSLSFGVIKAPQFFFSIKTVTSSKANSLNLWYCTNDTFQILYYIVVFGSISTVLQMCGVPRGSDWVKEL